MREGFFSDGINFAETRALVVIERLLSLAASRSFSVRRESSDKREKTTFQRRLNAKSCHGRDEFSSRSRASVIMVSPCFSNLRQITDARKIITFGRRGKGNVRQIFGVTRRRRVRKFTAVYFVMAKCGGKSTTAARGRLIYKYSRRRK